MVSEKYLFAILYLFVSQEQSEFLWKLRDDLQKNCSVGFLKELLEENRMNLRGGESDVCACLFIFALLLHYTSYL